MPNVLLSNRRDRKTRTCARQLWEQGRQHCRTDLRHRVGSFFFIVPPLNFALLLRLFLGQKAGEESATGSKSERGPMLQPREGGIAVFLVGTPGAPTCACRASVFTVNPGLAFGTVVHDTQLCLRRGKILSRRHGVARCRHRLRHHGRGRRASMGHRSSTPCGISAGWSTRCGNGFVGRVDCG